MTQANPQLTASFEYARRLRDPMFRKIIEDHGCGGERDVVVTLDSTLVVEVLDRVFIRCRPPALVAVSRPAAPYGFVFLVVLPATEPTESTGKPEPQPMSEDITIGMLYDAIPSADGTEFRLGPRRVYNVQPLRPELVGS